ncbi:quinone oxidoreductase family protein [Rhodovibrionaceae bacterium A322]
MTHAIRFHETGGPEVLKWEEVQVGDPGPKEVRLSHGAVGLNFIDVYHRSGLYPTTDRPSPIGMEAAGTVVAVGSEVTDLKEGDRVAYATPPLGAYAEERLIDADLVVKIPDAISDETAAAMMLQGMTVQYLIRRTYRVKQGETVLFHAAAGGVGLIACQWLKALGVTTIGTVGSDEKAALAKAHGCTHTVNYNSENFVERVKELTDGQGVPVVYDSVGKDTWDGSLDCLQPLGTMVTFGNASGPVDPVNLGILAQKGSLFVTRPTLMSYNAKRSDLVASANELFEIVGSGDVKIEINQRYPLSEAAQAHRDLEARKTTGSTIFTL